MEDEKQFSNSSFWITSVNFREQSRKIKVIKFSYVQTYYMAMERLIVEGTWYFSPFVRGSPRRQRHKTPNLIVSTILVVGLGGKSLEPKRICKVGFSKHVFEIRREKSIRKATPPPSCPGSFVCARVDSGVETLHCTAYHVSFSRLHLHISCERAWL